MGLKFMATLGASRTTTCDLDQHWQADVSRGPPQNALVLDESEFIETIVLISKGLLEARKLVTWSDSLWQRGFEYILGIRRQERCSVQFIHESVRQYFMQQGLQRLNPDMGGDSHIHSSEQLTQWCRDYWSLAARAGLNRFAPVPYSEHSDERSAYNFLGTPCIPA